MNSASWFGFYRSSSGDYVLEILISDRINRQYGEEVAGLDPEITVCVIDGDSVTPEPVRPRVLLYTAEIPGSTIEHLLARYPTIDWIQVASAGVEAALPHLKGYRGLVTNMTGLHSEAVSEWVLAMILAYTRKLDAVFANSRQGVWKREVGDEVAGKTLGVVGVGWIGASVGSKARAFGMDVIGVRKSAEPDPNFSHISGLDGLPDLLENSHYVLMSVPLTSETRGMIDDRAFGLMRSDAVLINAARGPVVDTDALVRAVESRTIAGAILDVTDPEPLPEGHPLWSQPNVVISAHSAWLSVHAVSRIVNLFSENFRLWMADKPMLNVIDAKREY